MAQNDHERQTPGETGIDESTLAFEREKLVLERERLLLERERLETERLRHKQTVELTNGAAGRVVLPATSFILTILVALLLGGTVGAWIGASQMRPDSATIAASVARAIEAQSLVEEAGGTNDVGTAGAGIFRPVRRLSRGAGYLPILD